MKTLLLLVGFGGAVTACTRILMHQTRRDADRWLNRGAPAAPAPAPSKPGSPKSTRARRSESVA